MDGAPRRIDRTLAGLFFSPLLLLLTDRSALVPSGLRRTHVFLFATLLPAEPDLVGIFPCVVP